MDVYVVFHVKFEMLLANGIDLHLYGICDTVQAKRGIWHTATGQKSGQRWLHSTRTVLCYRATSINSVV